MIHGKKGWDLHFKIIVYTHLSWEWCMKKTNKGNSGVRNIVHRGEAECTIFHTPLLPELGFFMHHDQERCEYSLHHVISPILSHLKQYDPIQKRTSSLESIRKGSTAFESTRL